MHSFPVADDCNKMQYHTNVMVSVGLIFCFSFSFCISLWLVDLHDYDYNGKFQNCQNFFWLSCSVVIFLPIVHIQAWPIPHFILVLPATTVRRQQPTLSLAQEGECHPLREGSVTKTALYVNQDTTVRTILSMCMAFHVDHPLNAQKVKTFKHRGSHPWV